MHLIIGGDSKIGKVLASRWMELSIKHLSSTRRRYLASVNRPYVDLESHNWESLSGKNYDAVVFCAGVTDINICNKQKSFTRKINVDATYSLAKKISGSSKYLLFLSSNHVFCGDISSPKINDKPTPILEYGRQKRDLEKLVIGLEADTAILRLTKVIFENTGIFKKWKKALEAGEKIKAYANMSLCPISIDSVIYTVDSMILNKQTGMRHLSGKKVISYYDYARDLAIRYGLNSDLVEPVNTMKSFPKYPNLG